MELNGIRLFTVSIFSMVNLQCNKFARLIGHTALGDDGLVNGKQRCIIMIMRDSLIFSHLIIPSFFCYLDKKYYILIAMQGFSLEVEHYLHTIRIFFNAKKAALFVHLHLLSTTAIK